MIIKLVILKKLRAAPENGQAHSLNSVKLNFLELRKKFCKGVGGGHLHMGNHSNTNIHKIQ